MTEWATVIVLVDAPDVDEVSGRAWEFGVSGIEEHARSDGFVELRIGCGVALADLVHEEFAARWSTSVEAVAAETGLDAWREHARAWRVGSLVVVPPWLEVPDDVSTEDLVLFIDPGHSFGSASHETTRRCLGLVTQFVDAGMRVADIGCGSGVLAIAAARLGATHVDATDCSPAALAATIDNAARNEVSETLSISDSAVSELRGGDHDVVLANIGAATLCAMVSDLLALTRRDGRLILSGILDVQVEEVVECFVNRDARLESVHEDGEWRTLVMRSMG